jgi:hypothetical protein
MNAGVFVMHRFKVLDELFDDGVGMIAVYNPGPGLFPYLFHKILDLDGNAARPQENPDQFSLVIGNGELTQCS